MAEPYSWHPVGTKYNGDVVIRSSYPTMEQIDASIARVLGKAAADDFLAFQTYNENIAVSAENERQGVPLQTLAIAIGELAAA